MTRSTDWLPDQGHVRAVDISPTDLVRWIKEEKIAGHGQLGFYESASKEYSCDEDFDRQSYGISDGSEYDLVSVSAVLAVEPHVEQNYWILEVRADQTLGPMRPREEEPFVGGDLTLEEFEAEFLKSGRGSLSVTLSTETPTARKHFEDWVSAMREKYGSDG